MESTQRTNWTGDSEQVNFKEEFVDSPESEDAVLILSYEGELVVVTREDDYRHEDSPSFGSSTKLTHDVTAEENKEDLVATEVQKLEEIKREELVPIEVQEKLEEIKIEIQEMKEEVLENEENNESQRRDFRNKNKQTKCDIQEADLPLEVFQKRAGNMFRCLYCHQKVKMQATLRSHILRHLENGSIRKCRYCDFMTAITQTLHEHEWKHTNWRPYKCPKCPFRCRLKSDLAKHKATHSYYKRFSCHMCSYRTKWRSSLTVHLDRHSEVRFRPYACSQCGQAFRYESGLRHHLKRRHTDIKNLQCDQCPFRCKTNYELNYHKTSHSNHRPFVCRFPGCKQACKTKSDFTKHMKIHVNIRNHVCDLCGKGFKFVTSLKKHASVHSQERNFECWTCMKKFKTASALRQHIRLHKEFKPYRCDVCLKAYSNRNNLLHHKQVHEGERPFKCPICIYGGREMDHLLVHIGSEHMKDFTYVCPICRKPFGRSHQLQVHLKNCHRENMMGKKNGLIYDPQYLDIYLHPENENAFGHLASGSNQNSTARSAGSSVPFACHFEPSQVIQKRKGHPGLGATQSESVDVSQISDEVPTSSVPIGKKDHPPVIQIGTFGGIGFCMVRKGSGFEFNLNKRGKKPQKWFMDLEHMTPADARRHKAFLKRKERESCSSQNGRIRTPYRRNFHNCKSKNLPVAKEKPEIRSTPRSVAKPSALSKSNNMLGGTRQRLDKEPRPQQTGNRRKTRPAWSSKTNIRTRSKVVTGEWLDQDKPDRIFEMEMDKAVKLSLSEEKESETCCQQKQIDHNIIPVRLGAETVQISCSEPRSSRNIFTSIMAETSVSFDNTPLSALAVGNERATAGMSANRNNNKNLGKLLAAQGLASRGRRKSVGLLKTCSTCKEEHTAKESTKPKLKQVFVPSAADRASQKTDGKLPFVSSGQVKMEPVDLGVMWAHALAGQTNGCVSEHQQASSQASDHAEEVSWYCSARSLVGNLSSIHSGSPLEKSRYLQILLHDVCASPKVKKALQSKGFLKTSGKICREVDEGPRKCESLGGERPSGSCSTSGVKETHAESHGIGGMLVALARSHVAKTDPKVKQWEKRASVSAIKGLKSGITSNQKLSLVQEQPTTPDNCQPTTKQVVQETKPQINNSGLIAKNEVLQRNIDVLIDECSTSGVVHSEHIQNSHDLLAFGTEHSHNSSTAKIQTENLNSESNSSLKMQSSSPPLPDSLDRIDTAVITISTANAKKHLKHSGKPRHSTQTPEPLSVSLATGVPETEVLKCRTLSLESGSGYNSCVAGGLPFPNVATAGHRLSDSVIDSLKPQGSSVRDVLEDLSLQAAVMQISSPSQENADLGSDSGDQVTDGILMKQGICSNDPGSLISSSASAALADMSNGTSDSKNFTNATHSPAFHLTSDTEILPDVTSMSFQDGSIMEVAEGTLIATAHSGASLMSEIMPPCSSVSCPFSTNSGCLDQPQMESDYSRSDIFQCTKTETVRRKVGRPKKVKVSVPICDDRSSSLNQQQLETSHGDTDVFLCTNNKVRRKVGRPPKAKISQPLCDSISKMDSLLNKMQTESSVRECSYRDTPVFQCAQNVTVKRKVGRPPKAKVSQPVSQSISKMDVLQNETETWTSAKHSRKPSSLMNETKTESSARESRKCNNKDTHFGTVKRKVGRPPKAKVSQPACHSLSRLDTSQNETETQTKELRMTYDISLPLSDTHGHFGHFAPEMQENEWALTAGEVSKGDGMCKLACVLDTTGQNSTSPKDAPVCFSGLPSSKKLSQFLSLKAKCTHSGRTDSLPNSSTRGNNSGACTVPATPGKEQGQKQKCIKNKMRDVQMDKMGAHSDLAVLGDDAVNVQKGLKRPKTKADLRRNSVFASSHLTDSPKEGSEVPDLTYTVDGMLRVNKESENGLQERISMTVLSGSEKCFSVNSKLENLSYDDAKLPAEGKAKDIVGNKYCSKLLKRKGETLRLGPDLQSSRLGFHLHVKNSVAGKVRGIARCAVPSSTKTSHRKVGRPCKVSGTAVCSDLNSAQTLNRKVGRPRKATAAVVFAGLSSTQALHRKVGRPRKVTSIVGCTDQSCTKTLPQKIGRPRKITSTLGCADRSSVKKSHRKVGRPYKVTDSVGCADQNQIKPLHRKVGRPRKKETLADKHTSQLLAKDAKGIMEEISPDRKKISMKNAAESFSHSFARISSKHRKFIQNLTPIAQGHTTVETGVEGNAYENLASRQENRFAASLSSETHLSIQKQTSHSQSLKSEADPWKKKEVDRKIKRRKNMAVSNAAVVKKTTDQELQRTQNSAFKIIKPSSECSRINRGKAQEGRKKKKCLYVELDLGMSPDPFSVPKRRPGRPPRPKVILDRSQTNLCFPLQESSVSVSPPVLVPEPTDILFTIDKPVIMQQRFDQHSVKGGTGGSRNVSPSPPILAPEPMILLPSLPRCVGEDESDSDVEYIGADYVHVDLSAQQLPLHPAVSCQQSPQPMGNSFQHSSPSQDNGGDKECVGEAKKGHWDSMYVSVSGLQSSAIAAPTNIDSYALSGGSFFDDLIRHCQQQGSAQMQREISISCTTEIKEENRPELDVPLTHSTDFVAGCDKKLVQDGDRSERTGARFRLENSLDSPLPACATVGISQDDGASRVSWPARQSDRVHEQSGAKGTSLETEQADGACHENVNCMHYATADHNELASFFRSQRPQVGTEEQPLLNWRSDVTDVATEPGVTSEPKERRQRDRSVQNEDRYSSQEGFVGDHVHQHQTSDDQTSLVSILGDGVSCKEREAWTDSCDQELPEEHLAEDHQLLERSVVTADATTCNLMIGGESGFSRDPLLAGQSLVVSNLASSDRNSHQDLWTVDASQIFTCASKGSPKASSPEAVTTDSSAVCDGGATELSPSEIGSGTEPVCFSECAPDHDFNEMEAILAGNAGSAENIPLDSQDISVRCHLLEEERGPQESPETAENNCCFAYDGAQKPTEDSEVHEKGPQNMHESSFDDVSWMMQETQSSVNEEAEKSRAETSQTSWQVQNVVAPSQNLFMGGTSGYQQSLQASVSENALLVNFQAPSITVWPQHQLHTPDGPQLLSPENSFDPSSVLNYCGNRVPELAITPVPGVLDSMGLPGLVADGFGHFSLPASVSHGTSACFHDRHSVVRISPSHLTGTMLPSPLRSVSQALPMAPVSHPYPRPPMVASQQNLLPYHSNTADIVWQACQHIVSNAGALGLADPGNLAQPCENAVTTIPFARETGRAMDGFYLRQEGAIVNPSILACNDAASVGTSQFCGQPHQNLVPGWRQITDQQTGIGAAKEDVSAGNQTNLRARNLENPLSLNYHNENIDPSENQYDEFGVVPLCFEADEDCVDENLPGLACRSTGLQ